MADDIGSESAWDAFEEALGSSGYGLSQDTVETPEMREEFRRARIMLGWVPENPSDEELELIKKVELERVGAIA